MRFLVQVSIPVSKGNETIKNGTLPEIMGRILDELKPEAAYFTANDGMRGGFIVVNISDPAEMTTVAEPFFLAFDAEVRFQPVMLPDDLMRAGPGIGAAVENYG